MPTSERMVHAGSRRARAVLQALGEEIRSSRVEHGLSQKELGRAAGLSQSVVSRIERSARPRASFVEIARLLAVLGLELSAKAYPGGPRIRDAAQRALLDRLRARSSPRLKWRFERPLPISGDQRAWDAWVIGPDGRIGAIEAETRIRDIQAVQRRVALKLRDDPRVTVTMLLVAGTRSNRHVLREHLEALRADYPMSGRAVLAALAAGAIPGSSGIVFL